MELWVRSQDKTTLIRSYEIYIAEYGKDSYVIRAKRTSHILGAYKTIERALEVLDEIQNIIRGKYAISLDMKAALSKGISQKEAEKMLMQVAVYEMPEE